ncbi:hypothetical protein PCE1_003136 [Barthelona sp. PCE]
MSDGVAACFGKVENRQLIPTEEGVLRVSTSYKLLRLIFEVKKEILFEKTILLPSSILIKSISKRSDSGSPQIYRFIFDNGTEFEDSAYFFFTTTNSAVDQQFFTYLQQKTALETKYYYNETYFGHGDRSIFHKINRRRILGVPMNIDDEEFAEHLRALVDMGGRRRSRQEVDYPPQDMNFSNFLLGVVEHLQSNNVNITEEENGNLRAMLPATVAGSPDRLDSTFNSPSFRDFLQIFNETLESGQLGYYSGEFGFPNHTLDNSQSLMNHLVREQPNFQNQRRRARDDENEEEYDEENDIVLPPHPACDMQ